MIEFARLQELFENIRENTDWNLDAPLLWSYYFADTDPKKLETAADVLATQGYRKVSVTQAAQDSNAAGLYYLQVDKNEVHSAQTLHERNQQLIAFAQSQGLQAYDGMDVGPADMTPGQHNPPL